jgi:hypothetical protein
MSIFEDIEKAEALDPSAPFEIESGKFLDLVDIWVSCGYLLSSIEEQNDKDATEAILRISDTYGKLGEKYAGE